MNNGNEKLLAIIVALRKWPKWALVLVTVGTVVCIGIAMFLLIPRSSQTLGGSPTLSSTGLAFGVFLKLGVVVLLMIGAAIVLKRWQTNARITQSKQVTIIETIHLSPHRSLYLVNFGEQNILIGATDQSITTLSQLSVTTQKEITLDADSTPKFSDYLTRANASSKNSGDTQ